MRCWNTHLAVNVGEGINCEAEGQDKSPYYGDYVTPVQCRMARAALGWGVLDLAKAAAVSSQTIVRFERGETLKPKTVDHLQAIFEASGIEFIPANGGGPGVRLAHSPEEN